MRGSLFGVCKARMQALDNGNVVWVLELWILNPPVLNNPLLWPPRRALNPERLACWVYRG